MASSLLHAVVMVSVLLATASSQIERRRRADDHPYDAEVEQLAQQVNSLNAQLSAALTRIATLETKASTLEQSVAFFAYNHENPIHTTPHGALVLNRASTNIGNAYDTSTGYFTVPVSGLYEFQATFMSYTSTDTKVYAGIYLDNHQLVQGVADSGHNYWDQTSIRTVVHATANQRVVMKNDENSIDQFYAYQYTTFSGFLIKAD